MGLKEKVINVTLKAIEGTIADLLDSSKGIKTSLKHSAEEIDLQYIRLKKSEEPLLKCSINDKYSLLTTQRIISHSIDINKEISLNNVKFVRRLIPEYHGLNGVRIIGEDDDEMLLEYDNSKVSYFAYMLILNLTWKLQKGRWFLNPGGDVYE